MKDYLVVITTTRSVTVKAETAMGALTVARAQWTLTTDETIVEEEIQEIA